MTSRAATVGPFTQPLALATLTPDEGALCILRRANYIRWMIVTRCSLICKCKSSTTVPTDGWASIGVRAGWGPSETTGRGVGGYLNLYKQYGSEFSRTIMETFVVIMKPLPLPGILQEKRSG